jgi:hypothetical protein
LNTLKPAGQVKFAWDDLYVTSLASTVKNSTTPDWTGAIDVTWRDAQLGITRVSPLGDYRLNVTGQGTTGQWQLFTLRGVLQLSGHGGWRGAAWQFDGQALADEKQREALLPLLTWLGKMQPDGTVQLQFNHSSLDTP